MAISRRAFIQGSIIGGAGLSAFGFDIAPVLAQARTLKISRTSERASVRPSGLASVMVGEALRRGSGEA